MGDSERYKSVTITRTGCYKVVEITSVQSFPFKMRPMLKNVNASADDKNTNTSRVTLLLYNHIFITLYSAMSSNVICVRSTN